MDKTIDYNEMDLDVIDIILSEAKKNNNGIVTVSAVMKHLATKYNSEEINPYIHHIIQELMNEAEKVSKKENSSFVWFKMKYIRDIIALSLHIYGGIDFTRLKYKKDPFIKFRKYATDDFTIFYYLYNEEMVETSSRNDIETISFMRLVFRAVNNIIETGYIFKDKNNDGKFVPIKLGSIVTEVVNLHTHELETLAIKQEAPVK